MFVFWICTVIGIIVFGAMFWSMFFHRKSRGVKAATFHESTKIEILWTALPILILVVMAWPATKTLIAMEDNDNSELTVQITGSQWKWHYKYFEQDIEFYSVLSTPREQFENYDGQGESKGEHYLVEVDKPLVIPAGKKVRFLVTSDDVIHSWWVPAFAVKQDANPGFINEAWTIVDKPGVYRGQCAELCGKDHGYMPVVVEVLAADDFDNWIEQQKLIAAQAAEAEQQSLSATMSMDELMQLGEQTYMANCAACHQPTGLGLPPAFPALKGSQIALGDVGAHIDIVVNGKAGTGMQGYGKQLSLKQLAAVVTYERNAWGNNTSDAVQAADVNAFMADGGDSASENVEAVEQAVEQIKDVVQLAPVDLDKTLTMDELMTMGKEVYTASCLACHQAEGQGMPPAFPALKGSLIALGDVNAHIEMVVKGKPGTAMQGFAGMLNRQQLAAVITYERNAWGNNTGDMVQATDLAEK
jgi:cytochrome c oxidase subunit 2